MEFAVAILGSPGEGGVRASLAGPNASIHKRAVAPNRLEQRFHAAAPNTVWVGDITYLWTAEGWMYLAVWIDLYSRMVVGWRLQPRLDASLVTEAFKQACLKRRPPPGLVVHTDRGIQYASDLFVKAVRDAKALQSMSRKGSCYDNAVAESFFHSLKVETVHGSRIETREHLRSELFDYIERFYNRERRHSTIGRMSPLMFENLTSRMAA